MISVTSKPYAKYFQSASGDLADLEHEYEEDEEDDRDKYKDQLSGIGTFGRLAPDHSIPLLAR